MNKHPSMMCFNILGKKKERKKKGFVSLYEREREGGGAVWMCACMEVVRAAQDV